MLLGRDNKMIVAKIKKPTATKIFNTHTHTHNTETLYVRSPLTPFALIFVRPKSIRSKIRAPDVCLSYISKHRISKCFL